MLFQDLTTVQYEVESTPFPLTWAGLRDCRSDIAKNFARPDYNEGYGLCLILSGRGPWTP